MVERAERSWPTKVRLVPAGRSFDWSERVPAYDAVRMALLTRRQKGEEHEQV